MQIDVTAEETEQITKKNVSDGRYFYLSSRFDSFEHESFDVRFEIISRVQAQTWNSGAWRW